MPLPPMLPTTLASLMAPSHYDEPEIARHLPLGSEFVHPEIDRYVKETDEAKKRWLKNKYTDPKLQERDDYLTRKYADWAWDYDERGYDPNPNNRYGPPDPQLEAFRILRRRREEAERALKQRDDETTAEWIQWHSDMALQAAQRSTDEYLKMMHEFERSKYRPEKVVGARMRGWLNYWITGKYATFLDAVKAYNLDHAYDASQGYNYDRLLDNKKNWQHLMPPKIDRIRA